MTIEQIIQAKIGTLPESKQVKVLNFLNFLIVTHAEINPQEESSIQPERRRVLDFNKGEILMSEYFNNPLSLEDSIDQSAPTKSLFSRLTQIKISAPADFSDNLDVYLNGEKNV